MGQAPSSPTQYHPSAIGSSSHDGAGQYGGRRFALRAGHRRSASARSSSSSGAPSPLIAQFQASHEHVDRALSQRQAFAQAWHADGPGQQTRSLAGPMRARMHSAPMSATLPAGVSSSFSAPLLSAEAEHEPAERIPRSFFTEDGALHTAAAYRLASAPVQPRIDELPEPSDAPSVSQVDAGDQLPAQSGQPPLAAASPQPTPHPLPEPLARALKTGLGKAERPPDADFADTRASSAEPVLGHDTPGRSDTPLEGKRLSDQSADDALAVARRSWTSGSGPGSSISRSVLNRDPRWTSTWEDRRGSDVRASWSGSGSGSGPSARIASPSPIGSRQSPAEAVSEDTGEVTPQSRHLERQPQSDATFVASLGAMDWTVDAGQSLAPQTQHSASAPLTAHPAALPHEDVDAALPASSGLGGLAADHLSGHVADLPSPGLTLSEGATPTEERGLSARLSARRKPVPVEDYLEGPTRPQPASRQSAGSDYAAVLTPPWMESHRTSMVSRSSHGTELLHSQIEQIRAGPRPQIDRAASQELLGMEPSSPPASPPEKRARTFKLFGRIKSRVRRTSEPRSPSIAPAAQTGHATPAQSPANEGVRAFPMRLGRKRSTSAALPISSVSSASGRKRATSIQNANAPSTAQAGSAAPPDKARPAGPLRSLSMSSSSPPASRRASARGSADLPRPMPAAVEASSQPRAAHHEGAWLTGAALGAGGRVLGRPPVTEHLSPQSRSLGAFGDSGSSTRLVDDAGAARPRSIADEPETILGASLMERRMSGEPISPSPSGDGRRRSWNWRRRGSASAEGTLPGASAANASGDGHGMRSAVTGEPSIDIVSASRPSTPDVVTIGRQAAPSSPGQATGAQSGFSSLAPPPAPAPLPPSRPPRRGSRRADSTASSVTSPSTPVDTEHFAQTSEDARPDASNLGAATEPLKQPAQSERPPSRGSSDAETKEVLMSSGDEARRTAAGAGPGADAVPANVHAFVKPSVALSTPSPDPQSLAGSGWTVESSAPSSTVPVPSTRGSTKREKPMATEVRTPEATLRHLPQHLVADALPREYASPISRMRTSHARSSSDPHSMAGSPRSPLPALLQTEPVMATVAPAEAEARAGQRPLSAVRLASRMSGSSASTWGATSRPRSALSPMPAPMLDTRMDRSSWQSSQGPWLADVVRVEGHHDAAHGFATAERARLSAMISRSRTTSAPSARTAEMLYAPAQHDMSPVEEYSPAPRAETAVQASLAALAALENSEADGWQARWARDRLFGVRESEMSAASARLADPRYSRSPAPESLEELYHARPRHRHSPYASRSSDLRARMSSDDQLQQSSGRSDASRRRRRRPARSLRSRTESANAFSQLQPQLADEVAMLGLTTGSSDSEMTAAQMASLEARIRQAASRGKASARAQSLRAGDAASRQGSAARRLDVASFATPPRAQASSAARRAPIPSFDSASQSMGLDLANSVPVSRNPTVAEWDETIVPALARRMLEEDPTAAGSSALQPAPAAAPEAPAELPAAAGVPFPSAELPSNTSSPSLRRRPRLNLAEAARLPPMQPGDGVRARGASPSGSKGSRLADGGGSRRRTADPSGSRKDRRGHLAAAEPSRSSRKSSNAGSQRSKRPSKKGYSGDDILAWQAALHLEAAP